MREKPVSFLRSFGVALLCWTASGVVAGYEIRSYDLENAIHLPLAHYFVWVGAETYSWALVTPFIFLFSRYFPFSRQHWLRRILQYALLTVTMIAVRPVLKSAGWLYKPDQHESYAKTLWGLGTKSVSGSMQVALLLYALSGYQNAKREARQRELREAELQSRINSTELQMLRMQLHPHFLFNALQAASVLVQEDPVAAEDVLHRLSELLRVALDDMRNLQVPLEQEITFLEHYIEIQKQRFRDRLTVRFDIAADAMRVPVPSLLLQPLVENAIHHGIGTHKGEDVVDVIAKRTGQHLTLEVRNAASSLGESDKAGHGIGLQNTRARLEQMYGEEARLQMTGLQPHGVSALVTMPAEVLP